VIKTQPIRPILPLPDALTKIMYNLHLGDPTVNLNGFEPLEVIGIESV
jgi:hypothetical protein